MNHEYRRAKTLLWDLVAACNARIPRTPHAAAALATERDRYALLAVNLLPEDERGIRAVNSELAARLAVLRGPVTWNTPI